MKEIPIVLASATTVVIWLWGVVDAYRHPAHFV